MIIKNPIITGFNPDPCIIRVNDTFYLVTSTFEWFPGVQLYKSTDLANWTQLKHPINRISQLNMIGNDSSGGIWAPALSYSEGTFYLIYTDVKNLQSGGIFRDFYNYLITTDDIEGGQWSEPTLLNRNGFDPSLFHDDDGKKYVVNTRWDHRHFYDKEKYLFLRGIIIQEYSEEQGCLIGNIIEIFKGTDLKITEAPHLYKRNGYYYLVTAEGGTSYNHAVTVARSKNIYGPYEVHPENPLLSAKDKWDLLIQKSGHGSLTTDVYGNWYLAHLCGRPIGYQLGIENYHKDQKLRSCILGRETAIQKIVWEDDWPYLAHGDNHPKEIIEVPFDGTQEDRYARFETTFSKGLPLEFSTLRIPYGKDQMSYSEGGLLLKGEESPASKHNQTVVGFRQKHFTFEAETSFEFTPRNFHQMAGLMYRYDENNYYYLYSYYNDEEEAVFVNLLVMDNQKPSFPLKDGIKTATSTFDFRIKVINDKVKLYYYNEGWIELVQPQDATIISDEHPDHDGFTGAFIALAVHDLGGNGIKAKFKRFTYSKID